MEFKRKKYNHPQLNIAPLVDVILQLLIFFLLASHFIAEPAIKVELPKSKTALLEKTAQKTVYISKEGEIFFMGKKIALKDLQKAIKESVKDKKDEFVRIKADKESEVGLLVSVIDEIRLAGIKNYSIVTERKSDF